MLLGPTGFLGHAVSGSELFTEGESVVQLPILFSLGGTHMNSFLYFDSCVPNTNSYKNNVFFNPLFYTSIPFLFPCFLRFLRFTFLCSKQALMGKRIHLHNPFQGRCSRHPDRAHAEPRRPSS